MDKEKLEQILVEYGVSFTDALADRLMKEFKPCEDAISRQAVLEYIEGSEAELGHRSENDLVCQYIKELPSVTPQSKTVALLEKTYADFISSEGGEGWLKIDGKEYSTDVGYAIEGLDIFMEIFKQRLARESEGKDDTSIYGN